MHIKLNKHGTQNIFKYKKTLHQCPLMTCEQKEIVIIEYLCIGSEFYSPLSVNKRRVKYAQAVCNLKKFNVIYAH